MKRTLLLLVVMMGCANDDAEPTSGEVVQEEKGTIVVGPIWSSTRIDVCFEQFGWQDANARAWIQDAVERRWARVTAVRFQGWSLCSSGQPGIHVAFGNTSVSQYGAALDGRNNGVSIFIYQDDETQIRTDAVDVFGLALGTDVHSYPTHPIDALDSFCPRYGGSSPFLLGCSWPGDLEGFVVDGIQGLYGAPSGSVTLHGACLTTVGADQPVQMVACDKGSPAQQFPHDTGWTAPRTHVPFRSSTNLCLDAQASGVVSIACSDRSPRTWMPTWSETWLPPPPPWRGTGYVRGMGGALLTYGSPVLNSVTLDQGYAPWELDYPSWLGFSIVDMTETKCLVPFAHNNFALVLLQDHCNPGDPNTKWVWQPGGALVHFLSQRCLTPVVPMTRQSEVMIETCDGSPRQRWNLQSTYVSESSGTQPFGSSSFNYYP